MNQLILKTDLSLPEDDLSLQNAGFDIVEFFVQIHLLYDRTHIRCS